MNLIERVKELKEIKSGLEYAEDKIKRLNERAEKVLREARTERSYLEDVTDLLTQLEEKADQVVQQQRHEERERESAAKKKTLELAVKKVSEIKGARVIERPVVRFGTTDDKKVKIVAISAKPITGSKYFIIVWNGGGSWSDNGGQHYTESWIDFKVCEKDDSGHLIRYNMAFNVIEGEPTKEERELYRSISGGKLTMKRLELLEPMIQKYFLKNYKAAIVPSTHTVEYK